MIDPVTQASDNILNFAIGDDTASLLSNEDIAFINDYQKLDEETRAKFLARDDEVGNKLRNILEDIQKRTKLKQVLDKNKQLPPEDVKQGVQARAAQVGQNIGQNFAVGSQKLRDITPDVLKPFNIPAYVLEGLSKVYSGLGNLLDPTGERLRYQDLGIDPFEGLDIGERTYLGFGATRNYTVDDVKTTLTKTNGQEPFFVGHLIAGDKNSPIIFQMNENEAPRAVNNPGFTVEDLAEFGVQDAVPLIPEIAASIFLKNKFFKGKPLKESRLEKAGIFTTTQVAPAAFINGLYEYIRLAAGKELMGLNKDKTLDDLAADAGLIAALAGGGEGLIGTFSTGARALHGFFKDGKVSNETLNQLEAIVARARLKMKRGEVIEETIPNFKPTFGQRTKDPDLLELESIFLGSNAATREVRQKYLGQLEDNNRAIVDYVKNLLTIEGNQLSSVQILEKIAPLVQGLSKDRIDLLDGVITRELQEELASARRIKASYDTQRGNAFDVGQGLFGRESVDPTQAKIPGTFDNYIFNSAREFKDEVDNIYLNVLNPAIDSLPVRANTFRTTLINFDKAKSNAISDTIAELTNPNIRRALGLEDAAFADLLLKLGNRDAGGKFVSSADGLTVGQLRELKKSLDVFIKSTDNLQTKANLLKLGEALQKDIDLGLEKGVFETPLSVKGTKFENPLQAKTYVDNLNQQANENMRSKLLQDYRAGRFDAASFFDYMARQEGKSYKSMNVVDEVFQILDNSVQGKDFIPLFRSGFLERLRNATEGITDKKQARKIVKDFFENNSAIANRIFKDSEIPAIKADFGAALQKELIAQEKAKLARGELRAKFGELLGDDTGNIGNYVHRLLIESPDKLPTKSKRELFKIIDDNPILAQEVRDYLVKDFSEKIGKQDAVYGTTFSPEKFISLINDPKFRETYRKFVGADYVSDLIKIKDLLQIQARALGKSFDEAGTVATRVNKGDATAIIENYSKSYSEGQQLSQFILGPLNKYSVKFRIADASSSKRGFDTVTKLVQNPKLLDEFIKNRNKRVSDIRRDSIIGGFLAKQFFAEDEPERFPTDEVTLLPKAP